ncbi:hypothetical protein HK104_007569 [Borealophlyctis nickersoniae]|nr:hypothetical protein HK104_007569 [Borealophlyctis nickersoniae]
MMETAAAASSPSPVQSTEPVPPLPPRAIREFPQDSISITAVGKHYGFEIPVEHARAPAMRYEDGTTEYRLYEFAVTLRDPDSYKFEATLEYVNYEWNFEEDAHIKWSPQPLPIVVDKSGNETDFTLNVKGKSINRSTYLGLPFCLDGDHPGRWVNASLLARSPVASAMVWTSEEDETHEDLTEPLEDYEGRVWVPYECRYRRWSYKTFRDKCLARYHPVTHFWGDSNIRRALKAVTTAGSWCREWYQEDSVECQCHDRSLPVPNIGSGYGEYLIPRVAGGNSTIYFHHWQRIASWGRDSKPIMDKEGLRSRLKELKPTHGTVHPNARSVTEPSLAVLSLINSEASFGTYDTFLTNLPTFIATLRHTYPHIPIIMRTGQHFCCHADGADENPRRLSRLRVQAFNQLASRMFIDRVPNSKIWDVHALGEGLGRRGKERVAGCSSNHATRDLVEWENLILMNMMCNRELAEEKSKKP